MSEAAVNRWADEAAPEATRESARAHVRLQRLMLTDFRSFSRAQFAFDGRPVAIAGANGAGKTNILEAISLAGPGRGLRSARLEELPRIGGAGGWAVSLQLNDGEDERRFGVGAQASAPNRRVCRIDDRAASGPGAFVDILRLMWLTPAMDRLFMEGAGERRRFLDRMTVAHNPHHAENSADYELAMRQRQKLLDEGGRDENWLTALEAQMAQAGVAIAAGRRATAALLAASEVSSDGDYFPAADIALEGELEALLGASSAADVEDEFALQLRRRRRLDAEAGRALSGPHRSDLIVHHRAKAAPARLCSTGEQKALLIGLILANARVLARASAYGGARAPLILLLDEIAAHLDPDRRAALFSILDGLGFQAIMTGTDKNLFSAWGERAQYFEARDGAFHESTLT